MSGYEDAARPGEAYTDRLGVRRHTVGFYTRQASAYPDPAFVAHDVSLAFADPADGVFTARGWLARIASDSPARPIAEAALVGWASR